MRLTLRDILSIDVVARAGPEIVSGAHLLDRPVRWVHTSELAEAASLLKGGELLLTTGLGLVGRGPVAQTAYVNELASRGVAAVALELGWSFATVPEAMREAAEAHDLPLLALTKLVPFVEITEAIQTRILADQLRTHRAEREIRRAIDDVLLRDGGLADLTDTIARAAGAALVVETAGGEIVATAAVPAGRSPRAHLTGTPIHTTPIDLLGHHWGWLHLVAPPAPHHERVEAASEHGAAALALMLLRHREATPTRTLLRGELLRDLARGHLTAPSDIVDRLAIVDPALARGDAVTGVAVGDVPAEDNHIVLYATDTALTETASGVAALVDGEVLAIVRGRPRPPPATRLHAKIADLARLRGATKTPRLALGPVCTTADLPRSLNEARAVLALATELHHPVLAVAAHELAGVRLAAKLADDPDTAAIVDEQLAPLLRYDRDHHAELTRTLALYLAHGSSKTALARLLNLRRQSLYQRLAKIEELIGPIDHPDRRTSLSFALAVHQINHARRPPPAPPAGAAPR